MLIKNKIKTKYFSLVLMIIFCFSGLLGINKPVQAGYWGEAIAAELIHEAWVEAKEAFLNAMLASLKQQANNLIRDRVRVLLTGRGKSLVITDYDEFVFGGARRETVLYTRDFFRILGDGVGDATAAMYDDVEDALLSPESEVSTIDQYVQGGLDNLFDQNQGGGSQAVMAMATNPANSSFGAYIRGQQLMENQAYRAQKRAEIEAVAGDGFVSQRDPENNLINLPGSVIASLTAKAESTYMDMINQARSIPEIVGTVAANMLSKTIEAGVVKVTSPIDNQLRTIHEDVDGGVRGLQKDIYGGFGTLN
ncbi:MAG: hypothetical protein KAQ63_00365 [Candidatus Moranbacteria bacterium]|nr:hypothetical protein [Candidatus Moranbacteria bacterium]